MGQQQLQRWYVMGLMEGGKIPPRGGRENTEVKVLSPGK